MTGPEAKHSPAKTGTTGRRMLVLGSGEGWHADQLREGAAAIDCDLCFASYESLAASIGPVNSIGPDSLARSDDLAHSDNLDLQSEAGSLQEFDAVLTRTMPAGSMEQITFRLAVLHSYQRRGLKIVNPPAALEIAIDKFATLAEVERLGFDVPPTRVSQSRREAMQAFRDLGGDCVIKPIFGGEGKGIMRVQDEQLAWTTFATLEQLGAVFYVQQFVPPGGVDTRWLVIGEDVFGIRRQAKRGFRTNVSGGGTCAAIDVSDMQRWAALTITRGLGLDFAAVDMIDTVDGSPKVLEVNAIPGWRGAQSVLDVHLGEKVVRLLNTNGPS